jgi:predicted NACHT family NTPase
MTISRTLWHSDRSERQQVDGLFLHQDPRSHVVLGEAGMGKSTLLRQLAQHDGYLFCTARALINSADKVQRFGNAKTLVIDALDEVAAQRQGDAVDLVLRALGELGYPRFILSCRIADWRSATALQGISDLYAAPPLLNSI